MYRLCDYMGDGITGPSPNYLRRESPITAALAVDRIDEKILARLQADGRAANNAIAADVGLSASACLARIRRLEGSGLILGYHALIALERVRPTVTIFAEVTLGQHHPSDFARFERFASTCPEIVEAAQVSGPYDYLMRVIVADMAGWRELSDQILNSNLGVTKISSHVVMKTAKDFKGAQLGTPPTRAK
jgi:DNA-binding Lrp family transcriptional regulator